MVSRQVIAISVIFIFGFSIIISIPIALISVGFSPNYNIGHQDSREELFNSSATIDLNLFIEFGDIEITYIYLPTDYHAKIDLDIDLIGLNIPNKNYTDFFNIAWIITNNSFTLTMELLAEEEFNGVNWIEKNVDLVVTLNPNILCNINITIAKEGNVNLMVPWGVNINNVDVFIGNGNVHLDFYYCTVGGNITGIVDIGNIELKVNNVMYTQNSVWNLIINTGGFNYNGDIFIDIKQYAIINKNITGTVYTNLGFIETRYIDSTPLVGTNFTFYGRRPGGYIEEFIHKDSDRFNAPEPWAAGFYYYSYEYPAIGNYDLSFFIYSVDNYGSYKVNFQNNLTIL